jgi:hypothetical protein
VSRPGAEATPPALLWNEILEHAFDQPGVIPLNWGMVLQCFGILVSSSSKCATIRQLMTLQDLPPSLSLIAERHLARARAALEELGIDTADLPPAEILSRARDLQSKDGNPQENSPADPGERRELRRARERTEVRGHRVWRHDWRRRSGLRPRVGKRIPRHE